MALRFIHILWFTAVLFLLPSCLKARVWLEANPYQRPSNPVIRYGGSFVLSDEGVVSPDQQHLLTLQKTPFESIPNGISSSYYNFLLKQTHTVHGVYNLKEQKFQPIFKNFERSRNVLAKGWVDNDHCFLAVLEPINNRMIAINLYFYNIHTQEKELIQELPHHLAFYYVDPWFIYREDDQFVQLNIKTKNMKRVPIDAYLSDFNYANIDQIVSVSENGSHLVFLSRSQLSMQMPHNQPNQSLFYGFDFEQEEVRMVEMAGPVINTWPVSQPVQFFPERGYNRHNLSFSPLKSKYAYFFLSPASDATTVLINLRVFKNVAPYPIIETKALMDDQSTEPFVYGDKIMWLDEDNFLALNLQRQPHRISHYQINDRTVVTRAVSQNAMYLGQNKAKEVFWLEPGIQSAQLKMFEGKSVQTIKTWEHSLIASESVSPGSERVWFELHSPDQMLESYILNLDTHELSLAVTKAPDPASTNNEISYPVSILD